MLSVAAAIADAGGTRSFAYDTTLQLTGGGYASNPEIYAYDAEGNRTSSHLSASYTHDTANRLREDAETCYDYDANGNLVSKTAKLAGACTGAVTSYGWDVLNRLVRIDNPDGSYSAYRYDAQGRRIGKDVNGALTRYVYDDDAILLEYDGTNALLATYSHGEEVDQPLAMARGGGSYFYHTDHLGSVRLLTDAAGAVVSRYDYDAFGNLEPTSFEGVANPYAFTARERDAESGLMFYRARYYDPELGRFISEDPIGYTSEFLNLYRYAENSPMVYLDSFGLDAETAGTLGVSLKGVGIWTALLVAALCPVVAVADTLVEASGGKSLTEGPCSYEGVTGILAMAQHGKRNLSNEWSDQAKLQKDPCAWLKQQYDLAKGNSAARLKIKAAQKFLGCRQSGGGK